jgi:hypothetical protein
VENRPPYRGNMNLVERFFRDLNQQAILPGSFGSVRQLADAIMQYLAQHNLNPKRYVWRDLAWFERRSRDLFRLRRESFFPISSPNQSK